MRGRVRTAQTDILNLLRTRRTYVPRFSLNIWRFHCIVSCVLRISEGKFAMSSSGAAGNWKMINIWLQRQKESAPAILPVQRRMWSKGNPNQGGVASLTKVVGGRGDIRFCGRGMRTCRPNSCCYRWRILNVTHSLSHPRPARPGSSLRH